MPRALGSAPVAAQRPVSQQLIVGLSRSCEREPGTTEELSSSPGRRWGRRRRGSGGPWQGTAAWSTAQVASGRKGTRFSGGAWKMEVPRPPTSRCLRNVLAPARPPPRALWRRRAGGRRLPTGAGGPSREGCSVPVRSARQAHTHGGASAADTWESVLSASARCLGGHGGTSAVDTWESVGPASGGRRAQCKCTAPGGAETKPPRRLKRGGGERRPEAPAPASQGDAREVSAEVAAGAGGR